MQKSNFDFESDKTDVATSSGTFFMSKSLKKKRFKLFAYQYNMAQFNFSGPRLLYPIFWKILAIHEFEPGVRAGIVNRLS